MLIAGASALVTTALVTTALVNSEPAAAAPQDNAPVYDVMAPSWAIVAPVLDISLAEADLERTARTEKSPGKITVTLDSTVLFGKDSAKINSSANRRLAEVGADLKLSGAGSVKITGYTDDLGSAAYGRTLSKQRADAVAKILRSNLSESEFPFTVQGLGEQDPAVPNENEASRKINRRVVIVYQRG